MKAGFLDVYTKLLKQFEWPLVRLFSVYALWEINHRLFYCDGPEGCIVWLYSLAIRVGSSLVELFVLYSMMFCIVYTIEVNRYVQKELLK